LNLLFGIEIDCELPAIYALYIDLSQEFYFIWWRFEVMYCR